MTKTQVGGSSNIEDIYPLSHLQEGMLFHTLYAPDERHYLDHLVCEIRSKEFKPDLFDRAFQRVVERHQALRTAFVWKLGKKPQQVVLRRLKAPVQQLDWRELSIGERAARLDELLEDDRARGYDLSRPPLMRLTLLQVEKSAYHLVFSYHHIIMDGWSVPIMVGEWKAFYQAIGRGDVLELSELQPFRAYIDWLKRRDLSAAQLFWQNALKGFNSPTPLPDEPRSSIPAESGGDYGHESTELSLSATSELHSLARRHGLTLNTLVQATWSIVLSHYSNSGDVLFGIVVSGRPYDLAGVEAMVGLFTNTLPMRVRIQPRQTLLDWLIQLQRAQFELREYEWSPLPKVQDWSELPRGAPLFESVLIFQNVPAGAATRQPRDEFDISVLRHDPKNNFPLTLMVIPGARLTIRMLYDARRINAQSVARSLGHIRTVLESLPSGLSRPPCEAPFLTQAERRQLLTRWNDNRLDVPGDASAFEQFEQQARRAPDSIAATCGEVEVTYRELNRSANRLARFLIEQRLEADAVVALLGDRDPDFLTAILAIMKAGCAYLPLDPGYPEQRLLKILELSGAQVALASGRFVAPIDELASKLPERAGLRAFATEDVLRRRERQVSDEDLPRRCGPANLAYVIYTSGSTGVPKGAMIEHRGMLNHLYAKIADLSLSGADIIGQTATQSFDISVWQFLSALLVGGRVHIIPDEVARDPSLLLTEIEAARLTIVETVPAMLKMMLEEMSNRQDRDSFLSCLSCMIVTGEALPPDLCRRWLELRPQIPLLNAYGPTECSDDITHHFIRRSPSEDAVRTPIGHSVANMRLYILDQWLQPLPVGVAGELYAGGVGVGRGYLEDSQRTAESFVPDPFAPMQRLYKTGDLARRLPDGAIDFIGRLDHQIKIRGFRIEIGEIEACLRRHPAVREAVVLTREGRDVAGDSRLVAYIVPGSDGNESRSEPAHDAARVAEWQAVFDDVYNQKKLSQRDDSLHLRVWINSYTNLSFAEDEIFECVEDSVTRILSLEPKRVLEIGCGPGLLLFRIAPRCEQYYGTDISQAALTSLRERLDRQEHLKAEISLFNRPADNFDGLARENFDLIALNEVVQYFPDIEYLLRVLEGAVKTVRPGGLVFVGGVRNLLLLEAFHASIALFQSPDSLAIDDLRQEMRILAERERELVIAPEFFLALQARLPEITRVRLIPKGGRALNEFTKFRYDAIIEVRGAPVVEEEIEWIAPHAGPWTLDSLSRWLVEKRPLRAGIAGIANSRTLFDVGLLEKLASEDGVETVGQLRAKLAGPETEPVGIDPERVTMMARELGYQGEISWADTDATGRYDLILSKPGPQAISRSSKRRRAITAQPWSRYANSPRRDLPAVDLAPALRSFMKDHLPGHMIPSEFVMLSSLPLTSNGKVDRRALLAISPGEMSAKPSLASARTPTEELVISIWSEILGSAVEPDSQFFEAGGHSLLGTQVMSRVRKIFGIELPLRTLFDAPRARDFARTIDLAMKQDPGGIAQTITPSPAGARQRLSFAQQRLWIMDQMEADRWAYVVPTAVRVDGILELEAFEAALSEIVRRHDVLRTTFDVIDDDVLQIVSPPKRIDLRIIDLTGMPQAGREAATERLALQDARRKFDLKRGPLLRCCLLRWDERTNVVLFAIHHIVSDAWSVGVFLSELASLYNAYLDGQPSPLPELPIQYADFAYWQRESLRSGALEQQLEYWKKRLAGAPGLKLPFDRPRPKAPSSAAFNHAFRLKPETSKAVEAICRKEGVTLFMTLLAAFNVLLHLVTGERDIVVGTDVANRNRKETEDLIGFFINLLVMRTEVSGRNSFRHLLTEVRDMALNAYAHQELPFDLLTSELRFDRGLDQSPLFDVLFVFQNAPIRGVSLRDANLTSLPFDYETTRFDLALFMEETPRGLAGRWTGRRDLFELSTITHLSARFVKLVEGLIEFPDAPLEEIEVVAAIGRADQAVMEERSFNRFKNLQPRAIKLS